MTPWLHADELRVGLGCMRLSTDEERDPERADRTIAAALLAGITVFDTARAYGRDETELGHNERLVAGALRASGATDRVRVVTKGGMRRDGGRWIPDGRAKALRADCEASLEALDGLPINLYLVHAPDPRTPWGTTVRALGRLLDAGLVRNVGVSNVTRRQLDEALGLAPLAAIQVALSPLDDRGLRGGLVERCEQAGIALLAHSPLGGPRRSGALRRHAVLAEVASTSGASAAEVALAWLLGLSEVVVPIVGARHAEAARSAAHAGRLELTHEEREMLANAFGRATRAVRPSATRPGEVVLVMGIPGAGKSRVAAEYVARGYERLNRDERGGTLRDLATSLDETLAEGRLEVVLDNTYLGRDARSHVVETAVRHGLPVRCVWLDTPLADAQVNLVRRLLETRGRLPSVEELRGGRTPGMISPTAQMRALRGLEPPTSDEGFTAVERVPFERAAGTGGAVVFVAASALERPGWPQALRAAMPEAPHLVFDWRPGAQPSALAAARQAVQGEVAGQVEAAICPHPAGAPICWCRPPLPGLPLAFADAHGADPARSLLVGTSTAHRQLAAAVGARLVSL